MKRLRRLHLYLGCFFAPLLLFYVGTGWYQTVRIDRNKNVGEADTWVAKMTSVHKDQIWPTESAMSYSTRTFKVLVVLMSIALIISVLTGLYLAFRTLREKWLIWVVLALGLALPVLILWLSQRR
ncbi:MAG TPA: hypothetical protein VMZ27_12955 [Candidatus Saccharimonadales bacterium]|nr:hypothetical protein [Candidatus Saccharimonadales bacterium]